MTAPHIIDIFHIKEVVYSSVYCSHKLQSQTILTILTIKLFLFLLVTFLTLSMTVRGQDADWGDDAVDADAYGYKSSNTNRITDDRRDDVVNLPLIEKG